MKKIFDALEEIERARGSTLKTKILRENMDENMYSFLTLFYNDVNYNISKRGWEKLVDYNKKTDGTYSDVGELCSNFSDSDITIDEDTFNILVENVVKLKGNNLLEYCKHNILCFDSQTIKWVVRFFNKDLRIGISLKPINKIFSLLGYKLIEKFAVQLCGKFKDVTKYNLGFPVICGIKYDGFRAVIEKKGDKVTITSRQGKDVKFVPELIEYFSKIMVDFTFDGEILADDFSLIQKRIGRKADNIKSEPSLCYRIYDILSWDGESTIQLTQFDRWKKLKEIAAMPTIFDRKLVKSEETYMIVNQRALEELYKTAMYRKEEGIIIKLLDRPYEYDNRKNWYKLKKIDEKTMRIIDCAKGAGKYKDCIAKIRVSDEEGLVTSWVGSGMSLNDIEILEQMNNNNTLINTYVDIQFMEVTQSDSGHSLRHAVFIKLRADKDKCDKIL